MRVEAQFYWLNPVRQLLLSALPFALLAVLSAQIAMLCMGGCSYWLRDKHSSSIMGLELSVYISGVPVRVERWAEFLGSEKERLSNSIARRPVRLFLLFSSGFLHLNIHWKM
jgi:hypothetical protein